MTPEALCELQTRAYRDMVPWSARDFADLLAQPATLLVSTPQAFCLGRIVLDEGEILALATDPAHQRKGLARQMLGQFMTQAFKRGARSLFLEVAASNPPARAFYASEGFEQTGLRKGYYRHPDGSHGDALLMVRALTQG